MEVWQQRRPDGIIPARYLKIPWNCGTLHGRCRHGLCESGSRRRNHRGSSFGCGSSENRADCNTGRSVLCDCPVLYFFRNSINIGLPIFESPEAAAEIQDGDEVSVDIERARIVNLTSGRTYSALPLSDEIREMIADGGLVNHVRKKVRRDA